jgi:hypothetical protein
MNNVKLFLKLIPAAIFVIGLDIIIPFSSFGLGYVQAHGKLLLFVIAAVNTFIGGGIAGGYLSNNLKTGFENWFKPIQSKGELNPTYGFAGLVLVISILWILLIQP